MFISLPKLCMLPAKRNASCLGDDLETTPRKKVRTSFIFPLEIFVAIFEKVDDVHTLTSLELVCKTFRSICNEEPLIWKQTLLKRFNKEIGFDYGLLQKYLGSKLTHKEQYKIELQIGIPIDVLQMFWDVDKMDWEFYDCDDVEAQLEYARKDLKIVYTEGKYKALECLLITGHLCDLENHIFDAAYTIDYWGRDNHLWEGMGGDACGFDEATLHCLNWLAKHLKVFGETIQPDPIIKISWSDLQKNILNSLALLVKNDTVCKEQEICKNLLASTKEQLRKNSYNEYQIVEWFTELIEEMPQVAFPYKLKWLESD